MYFSEDTAEYVSDVTAKIENGGVCPSARYDMGAVFIYTNSLSPSYIPRHRKSELFPSA